VRADPSVRGDAYRIGIEALEAVRAGIIRLMVLIPDSNILGDERISANGDGNSRDDRRPWSNESVLPDRQDPIGSQEAVTLDHRPVSDQHRGAIQHSEARSRADQYPRADAQPWITRLEPRGQNPRIGPFERLSNAAKNTRYHQFILAMLSGDPKDRT